MVTPHQAIAEYVPWLPGSAADKAASLGVHKSTLFHWLAEAEGRAPAPREGRAGRKRHREPTWADVLKLARLLKEHGASVTAFGVTAERLALRERLVETVESDRRALIAQGARPGDPGLALVDVELSSIRATGMLPPAPEPWGLGCGGASVVRLGGPTGHGGKEQWRGPRY